MIFLEAKVTLSGFEQHPLNFTRNLGTLKQPSLELTELSDVAGGLIFSFDKSLDFHAITTLPATGLKYLKTG